MLKERTIGGLHEALVKKVSSLNLPPDTSVLDLGCGTGAWLSRLKEQGFTQLAGIDRDITQAGFSKAAYFAADFDRDQMPDLPAGKYDLITAIELLEHLVNPGHLFSITERLLSPRGHLLLTTPNIHSTICRLRFLLTGKLKQFDEKGDLTHIYPVLLSALQRVLPRYNLSIVDLWPFPESGESPTTVSRTLKTCSTILRRLVPASVEGDVVCMLISRVLN
jgi:2-polyprenyl-3-methyl-5-hydroxy-6-metoxy-1,4-benzoquinol methylase